MAQPRLMAIVTALLLLGAGSPVRAGYTLAQLQEIDRILSARDWSALATYVNANPQLLEGNDALGVELQNFVASYGRAQLDLFASRSGAGVREPDLEFAQPY